MEDVSSRIEVFAGRMFMIYVGTKGDLIKEGWATEDMFPQGVKRNAHNFGLHIPRAKWWRITRRKGGVYELRRWHDPIRRRGEAPEWDPVKFKKYTIQDFQGILSVLIATARGDFEKSTYGTRVHKLSEKDIQQLRALQYRCMEVITQARVERGEPARLRRVK